MRRALSMTCDRNTLVLKGVSVTQAYDLFDASYYWLCASRTAARVCADCGTYNILRRSTRAMAQTTQSLWRGSSEAGEVGIRRARDDPVESRYCRLHHADVPAPVVLHVRLCSCCDGPE